MSVAPISWTRDALSLAVVFRYAVVVLVGVLLVLPLWIVKYPPIVDYPHHLARAYILHHLNDPHQIFAQWYGSDWGPDPYVLGDLLLQGLQYVSNIYVAGRLFLTLCVLGIPVATWLFLRQASPGNEYLALWALPVAYNTNFLMGYLNYQLSITLALLVAAVWLAYLKGPKLSTWLLLLLLVTALYFTHLGGFGAAGLVLVLYTLIARRHLLELVQAGLLFVPGLACFLYVKMHSWSGRSLDYGNWHVAEKLVTLTTPLRGYSRIIDAVCLLIFVVCIILALRKNQDLKIFGVWMAVSIAFVVLHFSLPDRFGDLTSINTRFPPFAFLFALAVASFGKRKQWVIGCAILVFLLRTAYLGFYFHVEQRKLEGLAAAFAAVPEHSVLSALSPPDIHDTHRLAGNRYVNRDDLHFWAYGIIDKGWVSPSLLHQKGVQPIIFRQAIYLADQAGGGYPFTAAPPDWQRLRQDYDAIWANNVPFLATGLTTIGSASYTAGNLVVYTIRKERTAAEGKN
jgi:hypothetical protein